ncbi:MAG: DinB family protein [Candidatus Acidiferrales bacterium]
MKLLLRISIVFLFCVAILLSSSPSTRAQANPSAQSATAAAPAPPTSGVRWEILNELKGQEDKFVRLAQAIPAEKYTWRPAEGVRSVSEVFMHVAAANFNIPRLFGTQPPAGFKVQGFDKSVTDKAKVIETLKDSFAHLREAIVAVPDSDVEKQLDWFGGKNTYRGVMIFILRHMSEHLGQSIAYARMNGIVPPWTEEQQQRQQQSQQKPKQ